MPKKSGNESARLKAAVATLDKILNEELAHRLDTDELTGETKELVERVNLLIGKLERTTENGHAVSMDLALGISDCFEALSQVRKGNLEARVSEGTLNAQDELLSRFAHSLNETLADLQQTIVRQHYAIQTLSTPILQLWDDVLALPVIGVVDTQRSADIMEKLLSAIVERQAKYVILDITGVDVVDTKTADHFIKLINSAQLLGAQCLVTGIQPAVAQTLVDLGIELSAMTTLCNLQEGLRECLRRLEARKRASSRVVQQQHGVG